MNSIMVWHLQLYNRKRICLIYSNTYQKGWTDIKCEISINLSLSVGRKLYNILIRTRKFLCSSNNDAFTSPSSFSNWTLILIAYLEAHKSHPTIFINLVSTYYFGMTDNFWNKINSCKLEYRYKLLFQFSDKPRD